MIKANKKHNYQMLKTGGFEIFITSKDNFTYKVEVGDPDSKKIVNIGSVAARTDSELNEGIQELINEYF